MENTEVREALQTAILLGEVARTPHIVEINGIGQVQIDSGQAALRTEAGEWKQITRDNLDKRLQELMSECAEEQFKRQFKTLVLH